ncbi:MAG: hypothetical protein ACRDY7_16980 [Acidimicrobiia bacterium]
MTATADPLFLGAPADDQAPGASEPIVAAWLFGLALAVVTERVEEPEAVRGLLVESGGNTRALEGAYGRAVALAGEWPDDPNLQRTITVLLKALARSHRLV